MVRFPEPGCHPQHDCVGLKSGLGQPLEQRLWEARWHIHRRLPGLSCSSAAIAGHVSADERLLPAGRPPAQAAAAAPGSCAADAAVAGGCRRPADGARPAGACDSRSVPGAAHSGAADGASDSASQHGTRAGTATRVHDASAAGHDHGAGKAAEPAPDVEGEGCPDAATIEPGRANADEPGWCWRPSPRGLCRLEATASTPCALRGARGEGCAPEHASGATDARAASAGQRCAWRRRCEALGREQHAL
mmetsp:Transcript_39907/g.94828  ORF Transcript_39907/g.94828 Transcript_39907/m.94828 type:complete len:248 (+) Transcript_39907:959-1702(+)